ncbi:MAG TPA: hypothetical protein VGV37_05780 [Aliidongia sp.]|uniref:tetratricopeptide repeat protein n=1 Tax=Aliidongia sp. TaxID=1914230 RepID=UPI002DDD797B|nr:hypothetical protein [Aliidongia sp.]HEV2674033.1 hypothetical protein [Aliidongia sp.]
MVGLLALASVSRGHAEDLEAAMAAKTGDYRAAIARWTAFAQQGDPDAAYHLGQAYETGHGVPRDVRQAQYWYRAAAVGGSSAAAFALGEMAESAERPDGLPQDLGIAIAWYRRALSDGEPRARERLAALGAADAGPPLPPPPRPPAPRPAAPAPTPVRATPPAPVPAPVAHPPAQPDRSPSFDRVVASWRSRGLESTDSAAIVALETAARQGQPLAEYDLAYAYEHGLGVPAEPARAYAWYQRAAASTGPARLREAAETNGRLLGDRLSETEKQAAARIATARPNDR